MSARLWHRRAAAALAAVGVVAALVLPAPEQTEAAWSDPEYASGTFTAMTVPAPIYTSCSASGLLGLTAVLTITWRAPAGSSGLTLEYGQSDSSGLLIPIISSLLGNVETNPVAGDPGAYRTVVNIGLLGGLLGGKKSIGLRYSLPNGANPWTSQYMKVTGTWYALGLGSPTCALG